MSIKVGDKVTHKSGGTEMIVKSIQITCEWHNGEKICTETYDEQQLNKKGMPIFTKADNDKIRKLT